MELRNVIHKIRQRLQFDILQNINATKTHIKKVISMMVGIPFIVGLLGFYDTNFLIGGLCLLLLGAPLWLTGIGALFEHNKHFKAVLASKYTYINTVIGDFSDEQQKLDKEEVRELLKLHLPEEQFKYLSDNIKQRGFIIYDDVFKVYSELVGDYEREEQYKNHLEAFLKEHDMQEHQLYASEDNFVSATPVKHFNSKHVL